MFDPLLAHVLVEIESPDSPAGWDDAPTVKIVYERRSCGLVRIVTTRVEEESSSVVLYRREE